MFKTKVLRFSIILALTFSANLAYAQPGPPPPDPGDPVPITGIELLIGAGALLGIKRLSESRKPKT